MNRRQARQVYNWPLRMKQRTENFIRLQERQLTWLFIIGVNNSGTTLLQELLARHDAVATLPGEGQRLSRALPRPGPMNLSRIWSEKLESFRKSSNTDDSLSACRLKWDWLCYYSVDNKCRYLMEKSPPNIVRMPWLQHHFRPASFIVITRSPYAVAEGIHRRAGYSIERAARHWAIANKILIEDCGKIERILFLTYENLCLNPQKEIDRITHFLDLDLFNQEILSEKFCIHNSTGQPSAIENFNDFSLKNLAREDIRMIEKIAGDVMSRLNCEFYEA